MSAFSVRLESPYWITSQANPKEIPQMSSGTRVRERLALVDRLRVELLTCDSPRNEERAQKLQHEIERLLDESLRGESVRSRRS